MDIHIHIHIHMSPDSIVLYTPLHATSTYSYIWIYTYIYIYTYTCHLTPLCRISNSLVLSLSLTYSPVSFNVTLRNYRLFSGFEGINDFKLFWISYIHTYIHTYTLTYAYIHTYIHITHLIAKEVI